ELIEWEGVAYLCLQIKLRNFTLQLLGALLRFALSFFELSAHVGELLVFRGVRKPVLLRRALQDRFLLLRFVLNVFQLNAASDLYLDRLSHRFVERELVLTLRTFHERLYDMFAHTSSRVCATGFEWKVLCG